MFSPSSTRSIGFSALALLAALAVGCDDDGSGTNGGFDAATGGFGGTSGTGTGGTATGGSATGGSGGAVATGGTMGTPDAGASPDAMGGAGGTTATPPVNMNVFAIRLNTNGQLDITFGTNGVAELDLGPASDSAGDFAREIDRDTQNRLVIFARTKGDGSRIDADRIVARLTANGTLDTTFGTMGTHRLNIANLSDNALGGFVHADGKIVASGYTSQPTGVGTQSANAIVVLRLGVDGAVDNAFGYQGISNFNPFMTMNTTTPWGMAEAYGIAPQGEKYVTTGYGRSAASGAVDMVSFRLNADGSQDSTWGNQGKVVLDVATLNDRGRNIRALPGSKTLITGSAEPTAGQVQPMIVMLGANGQADTTFASAGYKLYPFGRNNEAFYGAAVAPSGKWAAATGYSAATDMDDDAVLAFVPLDGVGTEKSMAVPVSETMHDRFWGAAFDANDKLYAVGYVAVSATDTAMLIARYNVDGTRDATFGNAGVVIQNLAVGAGLGEEARAIVLQSDGKIVVVGHGEGR